MRVQLALNVNDLDQSIDFYSKMFGAEPYKIRDGYANFAISDPRSSWSSSRPPARERASTTWASRPTPPSRSRTQRRA